MTADHRLRLRLIGFGIALCGAAGVIAAPGNRWSAAPLQPGSELRLVTDADAGPDLRVRPTRDRPHASDIGAFRTVCQPSHLNFDDPIVFPGSPGRSHLHLFFGNTAVNHATTADSLVREGKGSCRGGTANRSSYWVPAMVDSRTGLPIRALLMHVYYKKGYNNNPVDGIQPLPTGLRMISGDPMASAPPASERDVLHRFECLDANERGSGAVQSVPACAAGGQLWISLEFPNCWDGVNLDSPDHRSHVAYSWIQGGRANRCPRSHPVALPQVSYQLVYPVGPGDDTRYWRLSSDAYAAREPGGYSMHGDLMAAWDKDLQLAWLEGCVRATLDCGSHMLGDGREIY